MSVLDDVLRANEEFAAAFAERERVPMAPARSAAVLTCMDARLDLAGLAGLGIGDAHVIRNAGGRASPDAIRSLVVSYKLLDTREWFVVHHSDCGLEFVTNETMGDLLAHSLEAVQRGPDGIVEVGAGPGSDAGREIDWLPIADLAGSVVDDVRTLREHPLVPARIAIYGFVYDVETGRLTEVPEASAIGKPS